MAQPHYQQHQRTTPKDNLVKLTQRISNSELKEAFQIEITKLMTDYDGLISTLQQRSEILEQENDALQLTEDSYQHRYEKAVREMQFFRKKYERAVELTKQYAVISAARPGSPSMECTSPSHLNPAYSDNPSSPPPSSVSVPDGAANPNSFAPPLPVAPLPAETKASRHVSTASSSSNASSINSGAPHSPVSRISKTSNAGPGSVYSATTDGESLNGKYIPARKGSWQYMQQPSPTSPLASPVLAHKNVAHVVSNTPQSGVARSATNASHVGSVNSSEIQQRKVDPIAFGGSDTLWDDLARSSKTEPNFKKIVSNFMRRGGSPNTAKQSSSYQAVKYGYGMIHAAVVKKEKDALGFLLENGANPNAMTLSQVEDDKVTPVYLAASMGWLPGLEMLLKAGADLPNARGAGVKNKSALQVAAEHCHKATVEYIVSRTQPEYHLQVDSMGSSALHYASASGHTDLVLFLINTCQLSVNQSDIKGETPLHWASRHGNLEVATLFIEKYGCDINSYNTCSKSSTPYDLAKAGGHTRLIEYYKNIGALSAKKMDKKREEEAEKTVPLHLESALSKNGLFGF
ncbi:ankyrin repeat-containing domain protein [Parasitella parasitica]|nr:ankyrin repeat-containing domain protein [Parasitella parasitica]